MEQARTFSGAITAGEGNGGMYKRFPPIMAK
jgi:hypothetical protein